ncbi:WD repeat-containing protein 91-like [Anneissia japonica]|uniref:WD repeat-containing protein 91-like n=1 Tax=Anneissia japonica TaxID=1529436 RepID=UPI0014255FE8|nr:WD repeat-containing protein 91-like [Anneissia japonica]
MASAAIRSDEMVKDYLIFRGLTNTLRTFEAELKVDKDKGFRSNRIVEQLLAFINLYDLMGLRNYWDHLERRLFSRLESAYSSNVKRLQLSVLRLYIVNAVQNGKQERVLEFFDKLSNELQNAIEWKEWFILPFLRNPEQQPTFELYFTKQWQETLTISLQNFLSVIFQSMPLPTLLNYDLEQQRMIKLQEENSRLRNQLAQKERERILVPTGSVPTEEIVDDSSTSKSENSNVSKLSSRLYKKTASPLPIRNPPSTTSVNIAKSLPIPLAKSTSVKQSSGKKDEDVGQAKTKRDEGSSQGGRDVPKSTARQQSTQVYQKERQQLFSKVPELSPSKDTQDNLKDSTKLQEGSRYQEVAKSQEIPKHQESMIDTPSNESKTTGAESSGTDIEGKVQSSSAIGSPAYSSEQPFLVLSQDEYIEHHSAVTVCKFSSSVSMVASADIDGVVKVWRFSPCPSTVATIMSKSPLLSLEWASKTDRLLLLGSCSGAVKLFDTTSKRTLCEAETDPLYPRIQSLTCSPNDTAFVCSATQKQTDFSSSELYIYPESKLMVWDMKLMKLQKELPLLSNSGCINCCSYNHNGHLLITGFSDGKIRIFDMQRYESLLSWKAHNGQVFSAQFSPDENSVYSMGEDGKFCQWSIQQVGQKINDLAIHNGATGPFIVSGYGGYKQEQIPNGKLFAFDPSGSHVMTCASNGAVIYKIEEDKFESTLTILGHKTPVVSVDWGSTMNTGMCLTGSMDGRLRVTMLLSH